MSKVVEYDANNSGGSWWLSDEDWLALQLKGWVVQWAYLTPYYDDEGSYQYREDGIPILIHEDERKPSKDGWPFWSNKREDGSYSYLGSAAKQAWRAGLTLEEAVAEWEEATGQSSTDAGCPCCGPPHSFTYSVDGDYVSSGPNTSYGASW